MREVMDQFAAFVAVYAPKDEKQRQEFIKDVAELVSATGKAIIMGAVR